MGAVLRAELDALGFTSWVDGARSIAPGEYAEAELAHEWSFWFGSLLTGIALICTFLLIAHVMTNDVSGAIKNDADSAQLSDVVTALGGKFNISAAGIGGSLLAIFASNLLRASIHRRAEAPHAELLSFFTSVEAMQLNAKLHELELLRDEREKRAIQHVEVCRYLSSLNDRAQRLNSIEVSVQTIGNEVSANLKNIMKDAMGEQLSAMLRDTMAEVAAIAASVQQNLTDSFQENLHSLATQLLQSLEALQRAIESQAQGQLDKILEKLQDTVSGGFQSESQKMVAALEGFARVVPALEQQLRQMTGEVAEESRKRSAEGAQATQVLLERVSSLVDSMGAQQAASAQAVERMQAAAEQSADAMVRRLETSGTGLVTNVLATSRAEIEAIAKHLQAATEASVSRHADIETRVGNAAVAVAQASEGLTRSARTIVEMSNHTSGVLQDAKRSSDAIQAASREFLTAGNTLLGSVNAMQEVVHHTRVQTQEQQALLLKQREYTKEVERLWPELFDTYLTKFQVTASQLGHSWQEFYDKLTQFSSHVGATFADNTENLSAAVDQLAKLTANGRPRS